ncbi:hypothetical protein LY76DRAFT_408157 [Colletotrichum caudatum]|nr:hypothetical protein LY76DRAFT_408157 [Colletotrichum caudatum]
MPRGGRLGFECQTPMTVNRSVGVRPVKEGVENNDKRTHGMVKRLDEAADTVPERVTRKRIHSNIDRVQGCGSRGSSDSNTWLSTHLMVEIAVSAQSVSNEGISNTSMTLAVRCVGNAGCNCVSPLMLAVFSFGRLSGSKASCICSVIHHGSITSAAASFRKLPVRMPKLLLSFEQWTCC